MIYLEVYLLVFQNPRLGFTYSQKAVFSEVLVIFFKIKPRVGSKSLSYNHI